MTLTKEWLLKTISELEEERYAIPGSVNKDAAMALAAMKLALASMTAEPVAYMYQDGDDVEYNGHNEFSDGGRGVPLYTAPPAPVVPETLPCPVMLEPGLRFGKGVRTQTMLDALQRRAEYSAELEAMTPEQRADHEAGMKEFAAMLQGAAPVTTANKLREGVAAIRNSGIAIDAEKIKADRDALNSPVIPDGWVACSERMPHIGVPVITCSGDVVQYAAYAWDGKEWQDWYEEYDKLPSDTFTHWHPRPVAPQQEA